MTVNKIRFISGKKTISSRIYIQYPHSVRQLKYSAWWTLEGKVEPYSISINLIWFLLNTCSIYWLFKNIKNKKIRHCLKCLFASNNLSPWREINPYSTVTFESFKPLRGGTMFLHSNKNILMDSWDKRADHHRFEAPPWSINGSCMALKLDFIFFLLF